MEMNAALEVATNDTCRKEHSISDEGDKIDKKNHD